MLYAFCQYLKGCSALTRAQFHSAAFQSRSKLDSAKLTLYKGHNLKTAFAFVCTLGLYTFLVSTPLPFNSHFQSSMLYCAMKNFLAPIAASISTNIVGLVAIARKNSRSVAFWRRQQSMNYCTLSAHITNRRRSNRYEHGGMGKAFHYVCRKSSFSRLTSLALFHTLYV